MRMKYVKNYIRDKELRKKRLQLTDDVSVELIVKVLLENADKARALVKATAPLVHAEHCACRNALQHAILTAPDARDPAMLSKLSAVAGRVLK